MKILLITSLLLFSYTYAIQAQNDKELMDIITDECCACIQPKEIEKMNLDELQIALGLCFVESFSEHKKDLKALGFTITDPNSMTKFGEDVGMRLTLVCPVYKNKIMALLADENSGLQELMGGSQQSLTDQPMPTTARSNTLAELSSEEITVKNMMGTLEDIKGTDYATIVIKAENGRLHEFLWLDYFEGSQELIDNIEALQGKKVSLQYVGREYFLPKMKGYYGVNVIHKLEFVE